MAGQLISCPPSVWPDQPLPGPGTSSHPGQWPKTPRVVAANGSQMPDWRWELFHSALHSLRSQIIIDPWFFTNALSFSFRTCRSYIFCVFIVRSMIDKSMALTMRASFIEISCVRFGCAPPSRQPRQTAFILCQSRLLISSGLAPPCKPDPRHMQAGCRYKV